MKLNYRNLKQKSHLIKSATGLSLKQFDYLLSEFEKHWEEYNKKYTYEGKPRQRARNPRTNSTFKQTADMLIFMLYDYRHNPTQDFMGLHFNLPQPKSSDVDKRIGPHIRKEFKTFWINATTS